MLTLIVTYRESWKHGGARVGLRTSAFWESLKVEILQSPKQHSTVLRLTMTKY